MCPLTIAPDQPLPGTGAAGMWTLIGMMIESESASGGVLMVFVTTCADSACLGSCPHGLEIATLTREAHARLGGV